MTDSVHANLTGSDLHEPKGAATALSGQVYVSDGAGSGVWTPASNVITNTAFTTGDIKDTHKASADAGWILWGTGSIGDGSSGATLRANADTAALFTLYWTINYTGQNISGGRGVSAAADFAAHKTLQLPPGPGRARVTAGTGTGLTTRVLCETAGEEAHTLILAELPAITSTGNNTITVGSSSLGIVTASSVLSSGAAGGSNNQLSGASNTTSIVFSNSNAISVTSTGTSGGSHNNIQPSAFVNTMIKL